MLAATRDLLDSLDPLPYRQRMRRLAGWARASPERAEVCADLRGGGPYERGLALLAAAATRDADGIRAATGDPQAAIRAGALRVALRTGVLTALPPDRSAVDRRIVYRTVRRMRAPRLADSMITEVRARHGDAEAAALLAACSPATVRALLPDLGHAVNLNALARSRPAEVLAHVTGLLEAAPAPEDRIPIVNRTCSALFACDPAGVLDLLERHAAENHLPGHSGDYARLAAHDPGRVVRLLTTPGRAGWLEYQSLSPALLRRLAVLPDEQLVPLARGVRRNCSFAGLLRAVAPARRGALYDAALSEVDTTTLVPSDAVMEVLPVAVRVREATRVLGLPEIRDSERDVLAWSGYLAWPEASGAAVQALRAGDAGRRAHAYTVLVHAARRSRDPQAVAEVVTRFGRLRNEQDPVRSAALTALPGVARLLTAGTADGLTRITTDVVEARDASTATTNALATLAAETLRRHVGVPELIEWALLTIDLMTGGTQVPALLPFDDVLRRGQEVAVFDRLHGWAGAAAARGAYGLLFALTRAFGRRAERLPGLQEMLHRATRPPRSAWVARRAIELWLESPRGRGDRVAEILAADPSAVAIPIVWEAVSTHRTDLLDVVLADPPQGRFVEPGAPWAPGPVRRPQRWLPRQQIRYAELQAARIGDTGLRVWERAAAIRAVAAIPGAGRDLVLRQVGATEVVIAEAALGALAWTDQPDESLTLLLGHAGDDRARVALYAAGRAAAHVPPSRLPALLVPILTGPAKVTSRKEAARLIARYGPPGQMTVLLRAYTDPQAHRDVRAAIVSAARRRLDAGPSWTILAAAGSGSREECLAVLATAPHLIPERHRARYAELVVAACRAPDREVRRTAFEALPAWHRWAGDPTALVAERLTDLGEILTPTELAPLLGTLRGDALDDILTRLADRDAADPGAGRDADDRAADRDAADRDAADPGSGRDAAGWDGMGDGPDGPGRDRPVRRRIEALTTAAVVWSRTVPAGSDRSGALTALRRLAGRPGYRPAATIALAGLGRLDDLDEVADLCAGQPVLAARAAERVGARLCELPGEPAERRSTATRLAARGDLAGGLFAVALARTGAAHGWAQPWRELLLRLREHPDADVRDEAYAVEMTWT